LIANVNWRSSMCMRLVSLFLRRLHAGATARRQCDDRDHHKEFDQGEARLSRRSMTGRPMERRSQNRRTGAFRTFFPMGVICASDLRRMRNANDATPLKIATEGSGI